MHDSSWQAALGLVAFATPVTFAAAALLAPRTAPFRGAAIATKLAACAAMVLAIGWVAAGAPDLVLTAGQRARAWASVRVDAVTVVMLALVSFISLVIVRFSGRYLAGDPGQFRYVRWLLSTLAAVTLLIVADHLAVLALAWVGTSLALHQLLTFFEDRTQALVAAHKKFLASRVADLCLLTAIALVAQHVPSLRLDAVAAFGASSQALPPSLQVAAVLFAVAAALKCAQLPFHGWLTQVMEAPTPVSALLHAGVVNIGGFLMIRLAPLMAKAHAAQTLLVILGATTAVVAALVMTMRVTVKVALAWSTIAQMGFMLVQCGLGAYQLALLHIVAHSLYKAHAFLSSGSAVELARTSKLAPGRQPPGLARWFGAAGLALLGVAAVAALYGASPRREPALWALGFVLALAMTPLLVRASGAGAASFVVVSFASLAVPALYFGWHAAFDAFLGHLVSVPSPTELFPRLAIVVVWFGALFVVQAVMQAHPQGRLARALYPRFFAGLYLDELFTRLTFRVWPPKLPSRTHEARTFELAAEQVEA